MSVTQLLVTIWSPIPTCLYLQIPVFGQHELSLLVYRGGFHFSTNAATGRESGPLRDLRASVGAIPVMHPAMAMKEQERQGRRGLTLLYGALFGLFVVGVVAGGAVAFHALEGRARVSSDSVATEESEENAIVQGLGIALWNEDLVTSRDISVGERSVRIHEQYNPSLCLESAIWNKWFQGEHHERLYWGTYRSMAYLGIRARVKESLLAGLMWAGVDYDGQYLGLRHYCEDTDNLKKWSWLRHDGSTYGRQSSDQGSGYGGDWVARVKVEAETEADKNKKEDRTESVFFYIADEAGGKVNLWPGQDAAGERSPFAGGYLDDFGNWAQHAKYPCVLMSDEMLDDPELMWTQFGLRSLGSTSAIYMKNSYFEAPNWRGPVWININYLVFSFLRDYSQEAGPYTEQATKLYRSYGKI